MRGRACGCTSDRFRYISRRLSTDLGAGLSLPVMVVGGGLSQTAYEDMKCAAIRRRGSYAQVKRMRGKATERQRRLVGEQLKFRFHDRNKCRVIWPAQGRQNSRPHLELRVVEDYRTVDDERIERCKRLILSHLSMNVWQGRIESFAKPCQVYLPDCRTYRRARLFSR